MITDALRGHPWMADDARAWLPRSSSPLHFPQEVHFMPALYRPTRLPRASLLLCCGALFACGNSVVVGDLAGDEPIDPIPIPLPSSTPPGDGGSPPFIPEGGNGNVGEGGCQGELNIELTMDQRPTDIIMVVDNSGSMSQEIGSIAPNLNANFAGILQAAGVDYQFIMLAQHGYGLYNVCVQPPLSGGTQCGMPPVNVPGQFYHYSVSVESHDALCSLLDAMDGTLPDEYNSAPGGFQGWLRPEAHKAIIMVSDDGVSCTSGTTNLYDGDTVQQGQQMAIDFDAALLSRAPTQFGTQSNRNYSFYSLVGLASQGPGQGYDEFDPIVTSTCGSAVGPGTGYQWLSKGTGVPRFAVCDTTNMDLMLQAIAADIIGATSQPCVLHLPEPPQGQQYDFNVMDLIYTPEGKYSPQTLIPVAGSAMCVPGGYYFQGYDVVLCPQMCEVVTADPNPKIALRSCNTWHDY